MDSFGRRCALAAIGMVEVAAGMIDPPLLLPPVPIEAALGVNHVAHWQDDHQPPGAIREQLGAGRRYRTQINLSTNCSRLGTKAVRREAGLEGPLDFGAEPDALCSIPGRLGQNRSSLGARNQHSAGDCLSLDGRDSA